MRTSYLMGRVDRILRARLEAALDPASITVAELTALSVLATRPGLSNARLARRSLVTPQAMHKVMRSLEERGLVTRSASELGGRALEAEITEAGRTLLNELDTVMDAVEDEVLGGLSSDERITLQRLLRQVGKVDSPG